MKPQKKEEKKSLWSFGQNNRNSEQTEMGKNVPTAHTPPLSSCPFLYINSSPEGANTFILLKLPPAILSSVVCPQISPVPFSFLPNPPHKTQILLE